jgi:hypothetical protein
MAPLPIKVEHRVGLQVPAEAIWPTIMEVEAWPAWNPLYLKAEGKIAFDARLTLQVRLPGDKPRVIRPTVTDWTPNEQIIWKLSMYGGLLQSTRYIEVEKLTEAGDSIIFSNGEIFEGPLMGLIDRKLQARIKAGFKLFGEAVAAKAEAWRAAHPLPTSGAA